MKTPPIASIVALSLLATPAIAATSSTPSKKTETMVTKGPNATATTTVTTKVTPTSHSAKGKTASSTHHASSKHKMAQHHSKTTATHKTAEKTTG